MPGTPAADLDQVRRISAVCSAACGALAVAVPLGVLGLWAFASGQSLIDFHIVPSDAPIMTPLQPWQRLLGAAITLVPTLLMSYALTRARHSLRAFARGDFFASDVVAGLRDYARATFWAVLASLTATPMLSVTATWGNPHGHRELTLGLNSGQVLGLLGAGIVWVIAAAMARAATIAQENAQFV